MKRVNTQFIPEMIRNMTADSKDAIYTVCCDPYFDNDKIVREANKAVLVTMTVKNLKTGENVTKDTWIPKRCTTEITTAAKKAESDFNMRQYNIDWCLKDDLFNRGLFYHLTKDDNYNGVCANGYIDIPFTADEINITDKTTEREAWAERNRLKPIIKQKIEEMLCAPAPDEITANDYKFGERYTVVKYIDRIIADRNSEITPEKHAEVDLYGARIVVKAAYFVYTAYIWIGVVKDTGRLYLNGIGDIK